MSRSTTGRAAAAISALALGAGVLAATGPAHAGAPEPDVLMDGLLTPLSLAVSNHGTAYVSQNFAGQLLRKRPGVAPATVYSAPEPGTEVGAVSERDGRVVFATTEPDGDTYLHRLGKGGRASTIADLGAFERRRNPDSWVTYGIRGLSEECAAQFPTGEEAPPASYRGIVESHPYATYQSGGTTYVADAAANALLAVSRHGKVRKVAVLPGSSIVISEGLAGEAGFPDCAVGQRYWFEPVPTDVEQGRDGRLYVTSLPGGPEDPSLGKRGSIFRVNPDNGRLQRVVRHLMSPTGLAVAPNGDMFVAELFAGTISKVRAGSRVAHPWVEQPLPGDVEWSRKGLHATVNVLSGLEEGETPAGQLLRWRR